MQISQTLFIHPLKHQNAVTGASQEFASHRACCPPQWPLLGLPKLYLQYSFRQIISRHCMGDKSTRYHIFEVALTWQEWEGTTIAAPAMVTRWHALLTYLPLVLHICDSELGQHWFGQCLDACSAPSHYLNLCWLIVNWTLRNKLLWNLSSTLNFFIHGNALENVICGLVAILSRGRWVKHALDCISSIQMHKSCQSLSHKLCWVDSKICGNVSSHWRKKSSIFICYYPSFSTTSI